MTSEYVISHHQGSEFQEVYFNKYMTGGIPLALARALLHTFGVFFYFGILSIVLLAIPLAFLLDWQNFPARIREQWERGNFQNLLALGLVALLGLLGMGISIQMLVKIWATFFRIVRSRAYFVTGRPLAYTGGLPTFSGGRRVMWRSGGKSPDKLEVAGRKFDLNHCWRVRELLQLGERNFLGSEPLASGIAAGFWLKAPLRVWYVPLTGVLARVDIQLPGQKEILARAQKLSQGLADWYGIHKAGLSQADIAKTQKLSDELELLRNKLASDLTATECKEAEDRLATLEDWLSALDIRIPR
ncbi:MAG TPA: hypothetical protein VJ124_01840 [Pyrinomonadaceae bacterium]|nr:hypothetical protein [Pyrinomonadaceae bacterium]